ncbi:MAG: YybS family protein [Bacillota bacterium]|nr:YybS family protein [Bacillota bacterium]
MTNVRKLTEGAILLAVFTVLLLLTIYVPLLGSFINLFLPVPFILFSAKSDLKNISVFVVASFIISFIFGATIALPITFLYGLLGILMGYLLQKNKSRTMILILCSLLFLINTVILYVVSTVFFHFDMINEMFKMFHDSLNTSSTMLKSMGQQQQGKQLIEQYEKGLVVVKTLIPSLLVLLSFVTVLIVQLLSLPILKRFGINVGSWRPFRELSLPKNLIWYLLLSLAASLLLRPPTGTFLYNALANLTCILSLFMLFQGLTIIFYFFNQRGIKKSIPITIAVFSLFVPLLLYIIVILGIIDLGFGIKSRLDNKD